MKNLKITILFLLAFATSYAQKHTTGSIKAKKSTCDDLYIGININHPLKDTVNYTDDLRSSAGIFARSATFCDQNANYKIKSFGISVNGGPVELISGPGTILRP